MRNQGRFDATLDELGIDLPAAVERTREVGHDLSLDETFAILNNPRRRRILAYLRDHGETATIGELAEHIAAEENDIDVSHLSSHQRKRVYISLYQGHLPKMDTARVIDFDKNRGTVALRHESAQVFRHLEPNSTAGGVLKRLPVRVGLLLAVPILLLGGSSANVPPAWLVFGGAAAMGTMSAAYLYAHLTRARPHKLAEQ